MSNLWKKIMVENSVFLTKFFFFGVYHALVSRIFLNAPNMICEKLMFPFLIIYFHPERVSRIILCAGFAHYVVGIYADLIHFLQKMKINHLCMLFLDMTQPLSFSNHGGSFRNSCKFFLCTDVTIALVTRSFCACQTCNSDALIIR